jgi:two-component system sensor histidine kinase BaeS
MKLIHQITAVILATLMFVVAVVATSMYLSIRHGFSRYVRALEEERLEPAIKHISRYYRENGNWSALATNPDEFAKLLHREDDEVNVGSEMLSRDSRSATQTVNPNRQTWIEPISHSVTSSSHHEKPTISRTKQNTPPREDTANRPPPPRDDVDRNTNRPPPPRDDFDRNTNRPPPPRDDFDRNTNRPPPPRYDFDRNTNRPPPPELKADTDPLELPNRASLYDETRKRIVGKGSLQSDATQIPIVVDNKTVGWLGVRAISHLESNLNLRYLEQIRTQLLLITAVAVALGLIAGWLLTLKILKPVESLRSEARKLTLGDLSVRVIPSGSSELRQLANDFNTLAISLAKDENSRRSWVADTSHELRTPITILRGEIEAMLDGVRPIDCNTVTSLNAELRRLNKLVDDLSDLSRAEGGAFGTLKIPVEPIALLREILEIFDGRFSRKQIRVLTELDDSMATRILGDGDKIQQVYKNILENSARYTDDGGMVNVSAAIVENRLRILFDDSAPSLPNESYAHLFERFYRVETSRSREFGGSGLGLAICQRIVHAHAGTITAAPSPIGGVRIELNFPVYNEKQKAVSLGPASFRNRTRVNKGP